MHPQGHKVSQSSGPYPHLYRETLPRDTWKLYGIIATLCLSVASWCSWVMLADWNLNEKALFFALSFIPGVGYLTFSILAIVAYTHRWRP